VASSHNKTPYWSTIRVQLLTQQLLYRATS
jgi:hypothetical protein